MSVVEAAHRDELARAGATARPVRVPLFVWLFCLAIALQMFNGNSGLLHLPISPDRVVFGGAVVVMLADGPARQQLRAIRLRWVHLVLVILVLIAVNSAAMHGTLGTNDGDFALLDRLGIVPFFFFTTAPVIFGTPERQRALRITLMVMLGYLCFTATMEGIGNTSLVFPRYISDPNISTHVDRARGPFLAVGAMGLSLTQLTAVAVLTGPTKRAGVQLGIIAAWAASTLFVETRAIWLGAAVAFLVVCIVDSRLRRLLPALAITGSVGILSLLVFIPGLLDRSTGRLDDQRPVWDRLNSNRTALHLVDQHPILGIGWLRFHSVQAEAARQAATYPLTGTTIEVHNVLLARAVELGLPAAGLVCVALFLGPVRAAIRRPRSGDQGWRLAAIASVTIYLVDSVADPIPYALSTSLLWLIAGIALWEYERSMSRPPS